MSISSISVAITAEGSLHLPFFADVLARDRTGDTLSIELDSVTAVYVEYENADDNYEDDYGSDGYDYED